MDTMPANLTSTVDYTGVNATHYSVHALQRFAETFQGPHGIISMVIALAGIIFQIFNIMVLTNPKMRNPVNFLLTTIAVFEMSLLSIYVPFVIIFNVQPPDDWYSYNTPDIHAARYLLFYADTSVFLHLVVSWLIIATSCFRFIFVQYPLRSTMWCSYRRAVITVVATIIGALVISTPNTVANMIFDYDNCDANNTCTTFYTVMPTRYHAENKALALANIWIYVIFGKFVPSILLLSFTILLLKILREAGKRSARLHQDSRGHKNEHKQTTRMLLAVVALFTIIELPHGILLIYVCRTGNFEIYNYLGDVIDLVTLTAFSINFILYSIMSRQYRKLFVEMICSRFSNISLQGLSVKINPASAQERLLELKPSANPSMATESCAISVSPVT